MYIDLLRDYRGTPTQDALLLKGVQEVDDKLGKYLIAKKYATALNVAQVAQVEVMKVVAPKEETPIVETPVWGEPETEPKAKAKK